MSQRTLSTKLAISALAASVAAAAWGQETNSGSGLEEIVVTATRRAQDLQEVPVSIMAVTGEGLETRGIRTVENLSGTIPNLNVMGGAGTGNGTTVASFTVRGIPRVGTYIDGIWQVNGAGLTNQEFVDIDRIEVLRGPQGTLYGRDSTGGAIRIITKKPAEEFGAKIRTTIGTYDRRDAQLAVDLPLSENLLTKWTAASLNRDGYIQGIDVNQKNGGVDTTMLRGDMLWTPSDTVNVRFNYQTNEQSYTEPRIQDAIFLSAIQFPTNVIELYTLSGAPMTPEAQTAGYPGGQVGKWQTRSEVTLPNIVDQDQGSLEVNWDLSDNLHLQFLTGYVDQYYRNMVDYDASQYAIVEDIIVNQLDLFSQEIQLSGENGRFNWVTGLYYWDQKTKTRSSRYAAREFIEGTLDPAVAYATPRCQALAAANGPGPSDTCQEALAFYSNFASDGLNHISTDGIALFGEVQISLTDATTLTFGARHHEQDNSAQRLAITQGVSAPKPPDTNLDFTGGDPFAGVIGEPSNDDSFQKNTYRLALQHQFRDDLMGYVSYSEGFNSGGVSISNIAGGLQLVFPYTPETLKNYEVGIRSDWLDRRLRLNATVFHTDWEDIQASGVVRDPTTNADLPGLVTKNVGTARAEGLEIELSYSPSEPWLIDVNLGLLDAKYTDIALGTEGLVAGETEFSQAPESTFNLGLQHVASLRNGGRFTSRIDYTRSGQYWRSANPTLRTSWYPGVPDTFDETEEFGLVNARFTYEPAERNWQFSVFGTNLTNEYILNSGFFHGIWGIDFATVARPREAGMSLNFNFD